MKPHETTSLIQMISANQQVKFKDILINTTDLKKLNKKHSLKLIVTELRTNLAWYDLLDGFNIIKCTNFITGDLEDDTLTGEAKHYDLFCDYQHVTVSDVAESCQWYGVQFTPHSTHYANAWGDELVYAILQEQYQ